MRILVSTVSRAWQRDSLFTVWRHTKESAYRIDLPLLLTDFYVAWEFAGPVLVVLYYVPVLCMGAFAVVSGARAASDCLRGMHCPAADTVG